jgi:hypothetical protein
LENRIKKGIFIEIIRGNKSIQNAKAMSMLSIAVSTRGLIEAWKNM